MRSRLADDARQTLQGGPPPENFADIYWCYRLLLQRPPEFEDQQAYASRHIPDLRELVRSFLDSREFAALWPAGRQVLPNLTLMAENNGLRFWFHLRDRVIGQQVAQGCYEPETTALVRSFVQPGMNCLDLGANIGYFSVVMAKLAGTSGSVHSFEPFPGTYKLLSRNATENAVQSTVRLFNAAAHERAGQCNIFYRADEANDNFGSMFVSDRAQDSHLTKSTIETLRVDDAVPRDLPVHFVKIDVEGAELSAIRGMAGIIKRCRPAMVVELNEAALLRGGHGTAEELVALLSQLGYTLHEAASRKPFSLPPKRDQHVFANLWCQP